MSHMLTLLPVPYWLTTLGVVEGPQLPEGSKVNKSMIEMSYTNVLPTMGGIHYYNIHPPSKTTLL